MEEEAEAGWWRLDADRRSAQAVAADAVRQTGTRKAYPTAAHGESQPAGARSHHSGAAIAALTHRLGKIGGLGSGKAARSVGWVRF